MAGEFVAGHDLHVHPAPLEAGPEFLTVDRSLLLREQDRPKRPYVARPPTWSDVTHGEDAEVRFIERERTAELLDLVRGMLADSTGGQSHRLETLTVLGAPGSGKSTLVRRAAAVLAMDGECVVADFGLTTDRVSAEEVPGVIRSLERLCDAVEVPVLVVLDDPFFAESGWTEVLRRLARRPRRGLAVLIASPDFLYRRHSYVLRGRQIGLGTFTLERATADEARVLTRMHDREPPASTAPQDLLVLAMESAAGVSFDEIVERIWITLNDGEPLGPTGDVRRVPWPVLAYSVVSYFHRSQVQCPEPLLRQILAASLDDMAPDSPGAALRELVTSDGWQIFSVHDYVDEDGDVHTLIGTAHSVVAQQAWRLRPRLDLDVVRRIVEESACVPEASGAIADLVLRLENSALSGERNLARSVAAHWGGARSSGAVQTTTICRLVRALQSSRRARLPFRETLRSCLNAEDDQSWLAAWQLIHLTSPAAHPQEADLLSAVTLPWSLRRGDLSVGPAETQEIARRYQGAVADTIVARLREGLDGRMAWQPHPRQVGWLLRHLPVEEAVGLLPRCLEVLRHDGESGTSDLHPRAQSLAHAVLALVVDHPDLARDQASQTAEAVLDWLELGTAGRARLQRGLLTMAATFADDELATEIVRRLAGVLGTEPEADLRLCTELVLVAEAVPALGPAVCDELPGIYAHLAARRDNVELPMSVLVNAVLRVPAFTGMAPGIIPDAVSMLLSRSGGYERPLSAAVAGLGRLPALHASAEALIPDVLSRLAAHPDPLEGGWSSALTALWHIPALHASAPALMPPIIERLLERDEPLEGAWSSALTAMWRIRALHPLAEQTVPRIIRRFVGRSEPMQGAWSAVFAAIAHVDPLRARWSDMVPVVEEWVSACPDERAATGLVLRQPPPALTPGY